MKFTTLTYTALGYLSSKLSEGLHVLPVLILLSSFPLNFFAKSDKKFEEAQNNPNNTLVEK